MLKEFLSCEVQPPNITKVQDSTCTLLHNLQEKKEKKKKVVSTSSWFPQNMKGKDDKDIRDPLIQTVTVIQCMLVIRKNWNIFTSFARCSSIVRYNKFRVLFLSKCSTKTCRELSVL